MKHLCLLFAILSFLGCKAQKGHEDLAKEVIISGRVFNREVYPKEKEVKLEIPYLSGLETVYTSPIADDGTFCFRFSLVSSQSAAGADSEKKRVHALECLVRDEDLQRKNDDRI